MKRILAFGDSNTYGLNPQDQSRFGAQTRWTGLLQTALHKYGCTVIEEGLCGRTTVFEDPLRPNRRGIDTLPSVLQAHAPLDAVILMLGTNDCKTAFHASAAQIADGMRQLIRQVRAATAAQILVLSPILLGEDVAAFDPDFDAESVLCAKQLQSAYAVLAAETGCRFLAASDYATPSAADREHLDAAGHRTLASAIENELAAHML